MVNGCRLAEKACFGKPIWKPGLNFEEGWYEENKKGVPKQLTIDLDGAQEVIELHSMYGPKVLTVKGETGYLQTWPKLTSTEQKVALYQTAKTNRARRLSLMEERRRVLGNDVHLEALTNLELSEALVQAGHPKLAPLRVEAMEALSGFAAAIRNRNGGQVQQNLQILMALGSFDVEDIRANLEPLAQEDPEGFVNFMRSCGLGVLVD
mmetsp:Transcript_96208/g.206478  ORF Transcript_96208/g.206478 Transcript_96208/m.206478 type:complete len:208 (-) Transcript_96208:61-684(-)